MSTAQLSLELQVPHWRIRKFLESQGELPRQNELGEDLDDEVQGLVRDHFLLNEQGRVLQWVLEPGDTVRRRAVHEAYGGQQQGGISTPRSIPSVLVFTDPVAGARYGYHQFEGLREDGSYSYTGEGQFGDQVFQRGNRALRDSATSGKSIRLFRTSGTLATYVGEFTTGTPTFSMEVIPDADGIPREGIVFHLLPVDARVQLLPAFGGELDADDQRDYDVAIPRMWSPPDCSDVIVEATYELTSEDRVVTRVEFELQGEFGSWLIANGAEPARLPLRAGSTIIEPDLFVPELGWVVEAKRSTSRSDVRMAIGQALDYANVAQRVGVSARPSILLPGRPERDLEDLMARLGIILIFRSEGSFRVLDPSTE